MLVSLEKEGKGMSKPLAIISWEHKCEGCSHTWVSVVERPFQCPKCQDRKWDTPEVRRRGRRAAKPLGKPRV